MFKRPVLVITLALILTAVLTLAFSPDARAAVQALLDFNGVIVTIDEETGKLVVSGNLDAVIEQTDNSVFIQGENGSAAGVAVVGILGEMVDTSDILASTPDLVLPEVPAGFTLDSKTLRMPDGALTFTWGSGDGHIITYWRSANPPPDPIDYIGSSTAASESGSGSIPALPLNSDALLPEEGEIRIAPPVNEWIPTAFYNWEAQGYYHSLSASGPAITTADLMAMVP